MTSSSPSVLSGLRLISDRKLLAVLAKTGETEAGSHLSHARLGKVMVPMTGMQGPELLRDEDLHRLAQKLPHGNSPNNLSVWEFTSTNSPGPVDDDHRSGPIPGVRGNSDHTADARIDRFMATRPGDTTARGDEAAAAAVVAVTEWLGVSDSGPTAWCHSRQASSLWNRTPIVD